jgi:propionate catabolism operon transcriptional regulator
VLRRHAWPGNVRELENLAERLAIGCLEKGSALVAEEIGALLDPPPAANTASPNTALGDVLAPARQWQEQAHIRAVLAECAGNQAEAARRLGIGRTTLWRKLRG